MQSCFWARHTRAMRPTPASPAERLPRASEAIFSADFAFTAAAGEGDGKQRHQLKMLVLALAIYR